MLRIVLTIMIALFGCSLYAQSEQRGVVLEYIPGEEPQPLATVEVKVYGAGTTHTERDGCFLLKFRSSKVGQCLKATIVKQGYEVLNEEALSHWVHARDTSVFIVWMCPTSRLQECRDAYNAEQSDFFREQFELRQQRFNNLHTHWLQRMEANSLQLANLQNQLQSMNDIWSYELDSLIDVDEDLKLLRNTLSEKESTVHQIKQQLQAAIAELEKQDATRRNYGDVIYARLVHLLPDDQELRYDYALYLGGQDNHVSLNRCVAQLERLFSSEGLSDTLAVKGHLLMASSLLKLRFFTRGEEELQTALSMMPDSDRPATMVKYGLVFMANDIWDVALQLMNNAHSQSADAHLRKQIESYLYDIGLPLD